MSKPRLLDLFCGAGGSAVGYHRAGFEIVGIDNRFQPHYPFPFIQMDALEAMDRLLAGEGLLASDGRTYHLSDFDAIHASPPCQGYSVMLNLPWFEGKEYPLLILPTIEKLNLSGVPYVIENVMGARHGARGLKKRGLEAHGLRAGYLCGQMFGLPFYRHRLFATNWFWLAPAHPNHRLNLHPRSERWVYGGKVKGLSGGAAGLDVKPRYNPVNTAWRETHDGVSPRNGAQSDGGGIGHSKGWRRAAEAMGIDWMKRAELTQAIPPAYAGYIGQWLMEYLG